MSDDLKDLKRRIAKEKERQNKIMADSWGAILKTGIVPGLTQDVIKNELGLDLEEYKDVKPGDSFS